MRQHTAVTATALLLLTATVASTAPLPTPLALAKDGNPLYFSMTLDCRGGAMVLTLDGAKHWTKPLVVGLGADRKPMIRLLAGEARAIEAVPKGPIRLAGKVVAHATAPDEVFVKACRPGGAVPEPVSDQDWTLSLCSVRADDELGAFFPDYIDHAAGTFIGVAFGASWADVTKPVAVGGAGSSEGRFGQGLDANAARGLARGCNAFNARVLTVEAWVNLHLRGAYNIIVANGPKRYKGHWELYTEKGDGAFAVYLPGNKPSVVRSKRVVTDGNWHHVAMVLDGNKVRLYVDGGLVREAPQTSPPRKDRKNWELAIGSLHERSLRCAGLIDEVRVSACARRIAAAPSAPLTVDEHTVRLWNFEKCDGKGAADAAAPASAQRSLAVNSWKAVGGVPGVRRRVVPRVQPFSVDALSRAVATFGLETPGLCESVRAGVLRHWGEDWTELDDTVHGRRRLPKGAAEQVFDPHALVKAGDGDPAGVVLRRTRALLEHLSRQAEDVPLASIAADLKRLEGVPQTAASTRRDVYFAACALRRKLVFRNPLLDLDRVLFVARGTYSGSRLTKMRNRDPEGGHFVNQYFGFNTIEGGGLYTVGDLKGSPTVTDLLAEAPVAAGRWAGRRLDFGSVQGPDVSSDGLDVVFAHCAANEHCWHDWSRDTTWNLFRLRADGTDLRQLTDSAWNDFDPCWLPGGRVAFVSERRGGFIRCFSAYIKVPNYVLHSMKADGSDIYPLSFYETSEWSPNVDNNGMLVYTRWDYTDRENCLGSNIWICYPDGRNPRAPHGNYPYPWHTFAEEPGNLGSHTRTDTRFGRPYAEMGLRAIPGSTRYILTGAPHHGEAFGTLCILDLSVPDDGIMSQLRRITPYVPFPETECGGRSQYRYGAPWALSEDVYLCNSWEDLVVLDRFGNRELLCERELLPCAADDRLRLTEPIPLRSRPRPPVIPSLTNMGKDRRAGRKTARISVMNVYDTDIPLPEGTRVKYLRVLQNFLKTNHAMGRPLAGYQNENVPRMPLGLVPVEPDGSVYFRAPPGKELIFQLVDESFMAVHTMRSVAYVHRGELLSCAGCHEPTHSSTLPATEVARATAREPSTPEPELPRVEPISYYRHIKPLTDKLCVGCHTKQGKGPTKMGYSDLKPYVFYFAGGMSRSTVKPLHGGSRAIPGHVGARASKLGPAMLRHRQERRIPEQVYRTVVLWLDANCPRLTALHRERDQIAGELVWPKLDVDSVDPVGLEGSPGENTAERIRQSAALWHPAGPERLLGSARRFVVSDHTADKVFIVAADGTIEWEYACAHPQDLWMLPNGNVLVAWYRAVQEITPDLGKRRGGRVVWEYRVDAPNEIPTCQPLPDGNVLVGVCGPCKLLEVDRAGTVVKEVQLQSRAKLHSQFRFCRKTPEGTYLVPFIEEKVVKEVDGAGKVLRTVEWPHPVVSATRLANGNTLIGGGKLIREYAPDDRVVWELDQDDLGYQLTLNLIAGVRRLANGNTLVVNWGTKGGSREAAQMFEVTPDFRIVWRTWNNPSLGSLAQAQILADR